MNDPQKRRAELLLIDLKSMDTPRWYYISLASAKGFVGAYFLKCRGVHEANVLMHALGWYEAGCETQTLGPIDDNVMRGVPEEDRWRKLSRDEIERQRQEPGPLFPPQ